MTDQHVTQTNTTCRHCGRDIYNEGGRWVDPEASGDDSVWREVCDSHYTFVAEHEPNDQDNLEHLQSEASERRAITERFAGGDPVSGHTIWSLIRRAEAALDYAIAIAVDRGEQFDRLTDFAKRWHQERDQARADILKLRKAVLTGDVDLNLAALTDTERYETNPVTGPEGAG